jgi:hypothetical protein
MGNPQNASHDDLSRVVTGSTKDEKNATQGP